MICDASALAGWSLREPNNYITYMKNAGFVDVIEKRFSIPTAPWPKDKRMKLIGAFELQNLMQGLSAFALKTFEKAYGWSQDRTELFLMKVRQDMKNLKYHVYHQL